MGLNGELFSRIFVVRVHGFLGKRAGRVGMGRRLAVCAWNG